MDTFKGFSENETFTQVPDVFFQKLLGEIEDPAELKVTLYALWRIAHIEGAFHALCPTDFEAQALGLTAEAIATGLEKAVQRGSLLKAEHEADVFYFLNSPRGRAAAEAFRKGDWRASARISSTPPLERPNVYKLYEENIGPLTAMIADKLKDAEETYSQEWLAEAIERAVAQNVRKWNYIEAILKRWKEEGRAEKQDRRDNEKDRRRYVEGDFADFVEH
jgi:DNA replication protein